jgi:hypothetical protein
MSFVYLLAQLTEFLEKPPIGAEGHPKFHHQIQTQGWANGLEAEGAQAELHSSVTCSQPTLSWILT